tara:strand:- start:18 stop:599 length:582 start_codon:yes stop_codon:yes gene_type:complete
MFRNICLIGLPHSGKTIIGKKLYKHLNKGFVDTDDIIRSKYKTDLYTIISKYGRSKFLEIEQDVITSLKFDNMVISTGGSVIYEPESMKHLKEDLDSEIYHLFLSKKEFLSRTRDLSRRGVIIEQGQSKLDLYNERIPLYDKYSDKTISACRDINLDLFRGETFIPLKSDWGTDNYYWNPKSPILIPPTDRIH